MIAKGRKSCASGSRQLGAIAITFPKAGLPIPTDPHIPICDYFRFADRTPARSKGRQNSSLDDRPVLAN